MEKERKSDEESMTMSDVSCNGAPEKGSINNLDAKLTEEDGGRLVSILVLCCDCARGARLPQ